MVKRFFDALLGRSSPIKPKNLENLFAMSTAYVTLTFQLGLKPSDRAGVCFRAPASSAFQRVRDDLDRMLQISARETGVKVEYQSDTYGFRWIVLIDSDFEDLISTTHVFSQTVHEEGFGEQLLAAVFKFLDDNRPVYWIYNYKRARFYPFVPQGTDANRRDNAYELRLRAVMQQELPIEPEVERWYALWGIPV